MNVPKFSIIIPLYNKANTVRSTIESVLKQTESNFELIVVDDGSTDGSAEIVQTIKDHRIRLITKKNGGVSSARNLGIESSTGEYICFLDADDIWYVDFLSEVSALINKFPDAKMFCPSYEVKYSNRTIHPKFRSVDKYNDCLVRDFFEMATAPFWVMNSTCVALRRQEVMNMESWFPVEETVYEDFDFWIRFGSRYPVAHGSKICAVYNRETNTNARKQHSHCVVFSKSYMRTLTNMIKDPIYTAQQKKWLREIYDRRMVPYIFSLLLIGKVQCAREQLKLWTPKGRYFFYKCGLICGSFVPHSMLETIQEFRLKVL